MFDREVEELKQKDDKIRSVIERVGEVSFHWSQGTPFHVLAQSIVYQQLTSKAAQKIFKKLKNACGELTPKNLLNKTNEELRKTGLSHNKIQYLKDLARKLENQEVRPELFPTMTNQEIINELRKIKGIGEWTAEMFLIFHLKRLDVFSCTDYGLRKAVQKLHSLPQPPNKKEMKEISKKWKPYRTIAALYLWKWID